jgi:hypothetical protein
MATLLSITSLEHGLFLRITQYAGVPAVGRLAMTCAQMAQLTAQYTLQIMDLVTPHDHVEEIYLIRWRILRCVTLTDYTYKHIQQELARVMTHYGLDYICITYRQGGVLPDGFWVYWQPRMPHNWGGFCFKRVRLTPSTKQLSVVSPLDGPSHNVVSLHKQLVSEWIIYGGCNCKECRH